MRKLLVLLLFMLLTMAGAVYYAYGPLKLQNYPVEFTLEQGSSLTVVARQLEQNGLIEQPRLFVFMGRMLGSAEQVKAGTYRLDHVVSRMALLEMITRGDVIKRQLTIIEGWNFRQLRNALNDNPNLRHDTYAMSDREILQRIGAMESHPEGLFFPDTYHLSAGSSDVDLLRRAYQEMQYRLQQVWQSRSPDLPLSTPYQALILASIIEKETGAPEDRGMIAAVFVNRLRIRMMLQTDPTVIYGLGKDFDGNLRRRDLVSDTPYNTYTRAGLPPTPIALPGLDSLRAALNPQRTKALYFVARGDGSSHFSSSLNEHNRAVNKYQK